MKKYVVVSWVTYLKSLWIGIVKAKFSSWNDYFVTSLLSAFCGVESTFLCQQFLGLQHKIEFAICHNIHIANSVLLKATQSLIHLWKNDCLTSDSIEDVLTYKLSQTTWSLSFWWKSSSVAQIFNSLSLADFGLYGNLFQYSQKSW